MKVFQFTLRHTDLSETASGTDARTAFASLFLRKCRYTPTEAEITYYLGGYVVTDITPQAV